MSDLSEQADLLRQTPEEQLSARLGAALAELRAEHAQLVAAQAMAKVGSWVVDLTSGATRWSDEMHRLLQTDPAAVTPDLEHYLETVEPAGREATRESFTRSCQLGTAGAREDRLLLPDGSRKIVEARWQVDCDASGRPLRALGTCQDITERRLIEQQLRDHKSVLTMAARLAHVGAWDLDLSNGRVSWSDEVCAIHEVPSGTALSLEQAMAYYAPEWSDIVLAAVLACICDGLPFDVEAEIVTALGRRIWVRAMGEAIVDAQGSTRRIQGAFQDLSERKQAEFEARRLAAHLSDTIESITDCFYTVDRDWRLLHINGRLLTLLQHARDEVIGSVLWDAFPHLVGTPFEQDFRRAMREGVSVSTEAWLAGRQGWFSARAYPSEAGLTVQFRDVSGEHAARRHLELLEASVSQLNEFVVISVLHEGAPEPRIVFVNDAFVRSTGYERDELIGQTSLLLHGPLTDAATVEGMRAAGGWHEPVKAELQVYRKNGEPHWIEVGVARVRLTDGSRNHFVSVSRDITQRKRDQDALRDLNAELEARVEARTAEATLARDEAERASRAKSAFLATMSHEIRTPMNGVMGMIDVLHQTSLKGYQVEMVDLIRDSADTLVAIVDDILDFSKIEAGKLRIEQVPMQLADAVEKVCAMLDHIAVKRGVRMAVFVDPAIPRVLAGDETRVRQVLLNLCSNAIKFSSGPGKSGEMSVRVTLLAQDEASVNIELAVADNGIGMDEATLARLFTPFSQADDSTTRCFGGTGLGLAITSQLVRLMGGDIAVRSRPESGSTFCVRLRLARVVDALNVEPAPLAAGLHCRIVGAEQPLAHDLGAYLAHAGAAVEWVPDLSAAAAAPAPEGLCVWLILPGQDVPDLAGLRAMAPEPERHDSSQDSNQDSGSDSKTRFVVLGRGVRRRLRVEAVDLVKLDADAMFRSTLIKALSVAAGRVQKASVNDAFILADATSQAPQRHEARAQGRLVLVAEDNETNRLVIVHQLGMLGYAADLAVNGREALEYWRSGDYALLLTDLHMPEMDGYELAEAIRNEERTQAGVPRKPILALTANIVADAQNHGLAAGFDAYLTKPIRLALLRQALSRWIAGPTDLAEAQPIDTRAAGSAPAVDLSVLLGLVGDDPQILNTVLKAFRTSVEQLTRQLRLAGTSGGPQAMVAAAHKMKSGARAIGAVPLADLCAAIEKTGGDAAMNALLPSLRDELQTVLTSLDRAQAGT
jgi:PAS domain S-box-containing protein